MVVQPRASRVRRIGRWVTFAVLAAVIIGTVLVGVWVVGSVVLGPCGCTQSPSPTAAQTAMLTQQLS